MSIETRGNYLEIGGLEPHYICEPMFKALSKIKDKGSKTTLENIVRELNRVITRIVKEAKAGKDNANQKMEAEAIVVNLTVQIGGLMGRNQADDKFLSNINKKANGTLLNYVRGLAIR